MSDEQLSRMWESVKNANFQWLLLSVSLGVLSHMSRAWRWGYTIKPLGFKPKFWNSFFCVMIGYVVNLLIPRAGEVSRCAYMHKHEKIPFDKLLGTVVAERVADVIILLILIVTVMVLQADTLLDFVMQLEGVKNFNPVKIGVILGVLAIIGIGALIFIWRSEIKLVVKVKDFLRGILEGAKTILTMKDKWLFIMHTLIIWGLYLCMFYVTIFSINGVEKLSFGGAISAFVIGGVSIALTNGGIGTYPYMIMEILKLYEIPQELGTAYGWVVWTAQTIMILSVGLLSILLISVYNRRKASA